MKNFLKSLVVLFLIPIHLFAFDSSPPCYRSLQTNFFKYEYLGQALSYHYLPQSDWQATYNDLKEASQNVPAQIKALSLQYPRNPLDYPFQPKESAELLHNVLYQTFIAVMRRHSFTVESDIRDMFKYISQRQYGLLQSCLGDDADIFIN